MIGERAMAQEALFYSFNIERHVPANHLLRLIDRFVDLSDVRPALAAFLQRYWSKMAKIIPMPPQ